MIQRQSHKTVRLTKGELKKVRAALPAGSYEQIAESLSLGIHTVRASLFYPKRVKAEVITAALTLIEKEKQRIIAIKNTIKEA